MSKCSAEEMASEVTKKPKTAQPLQTANEEMQQGPPFEEAREKEEEALKSKLFKLMLSAAIMHWAETQISNNSLGHNHDLGQIPYLKRSRVPRKLVNRSWHDWCC